MSDVITHACSNFKSGEVTPPFKLDQYYIPEGKLQM